MGAETLRGREQGPSRLAPSVARVRSATGGTGITEPYPVHEAFLVVLRLQPYRVADLWVDNRRVSHDAVSTGTLSIYDLDRLWMANMDAPFDCLQFHVSQDDVDRVADEIGERPGQRLHCPPESSVIDPVVHHLGLVMAPALEAPVEFPRLFIDHLTLAIHAHLIDRYATVASRRRVTNVQLAPWQKRRAVDFLGSRLAKDVSIEDVARECRLSRSHFIKAFKASVGLPPHQWVLLQRVERAKQLMQGTAMTLADIAVEVGFNDQSHLTRRFRQAVGTAPAAWKRSR
ncbi:AraC family transcriptional regulator [Variovorax boronicumulans]|uniref:helix-turn-helix domain-containing protein n=1 Tax=Variovorax boronicumulans TaxID=436515 RepID=UPI00247719BB|nr:AraC family transcriptional regulator [Variovorax boronicumulans]MDH6170202.1 AraC family transcriptional regulator [Variovorax boronicumulans]